MLLVRAHQIFVFRETGGIFLAPKSICRMNNSREVAKRRGKRETKRIGAGRKDKPVVTAPLSAHLGPFKITGGMDDNVEKESQHFRIQLESNGSSPMAFS